MRNRHSRYVAPPGSPLLASGTVAAVAASAAFSVTAASIAGNQGAAHDHDAAADPRLSPTVCGSGSANDVRAEHIDKPKRAAARQARPSRCSVVCCDSIIASVLVDPGAVVSVTDTLGSSFTQVAHRTVASDHRAKVCGTAGALDSGWFFMDAISMRAVAILGDMRARIAS